ncbi:unnamed protein product [Colias eurytheme]|nr:unnamed protein product [Colias eurytheme]
MFHKLYMLILCIFNIQNTQRCILNTRVDFGQPLPVILRNGKLLEPDDNNGNVILNHGDTLTLSCGESMSIRHPNAKQEVPTAIISCENGDTFKNDALLNFPGSFSSFRCNDAPDYHSRRTNRTCFEGFPIIEVGYTVQNEFYPSYESCFNDVMFTPIYSKYTQKPYNALYQTRVERPYFHDNDNYRNIPVDSLFSQIGQRAAVAKLVGPLVDTYLNKNEILSRGHLAAKTDFVFAFTERATFHYVNCAPQWGGFNGGNWNTLEVDLRNHVHQVGYNTVIYTGTYGITQLTNQYGQRVDLYLHGTVIPIPQYFYKVVYEPSSKKGIAYVGINNPYYSLREAKEMFFCEDMCRSNYSFSWLTWHPDNPSEGYTFCCTIPDFRATINHLPYFDVSGVLI